MARDSPKRGSAGLAALAPSVVLTPSVGLRVRSVLPVLAVAALALGARPLGAQTPGPGAGPAAPSFDEAAFLSDLDVAKARRLQLEHSRIEQRLRSLVARRVDDRAARLGSPLPPQPDPRRLIVPVRDPGFVTSATGGISGTVTGPAAVSGLVNVYDSAGDYLTRVPILAGVGSWSVTGLATGTYYAQTANTSGLIDRAWNDQPCPFYNPNPKTDCAATAISVTDGVTTTGINFTLVAGGRISGMVTASATSAPIPRVLVWILDSQGRYRAYSYTNAGGLNVGLYSSQQGLPTGTYYVKTANNASAPNFLDEGYDNVPCEPSCAVSALTPVTVTSPATTAGIHFALDAGGAVSGTVTDQGTGLPGAGVYAELYTDAGAYTGDGYSAADGTYTVAGLTTGTYKARTLNGSGYINEVYDNQSCASYDCDLTIGDPISVTVGATTGGIDFALARGGSISGRVTRSDSSAGLPDVAVAVWIDAGYYASSTKTTTTDATGNYTVSGLAPGSYLISTAAATGGQNFIDEIYDGVQCLGFSLSTQSLDFYTVPPCRALDTRNAVGGLGGPALGCQGDRNFPVAGTCGVPFDAKALSVNVTVTGSTGNGHLRLHAGRTAIPTASSLNYALGLTRANNAIVPLGTIGEMGIYCGQASGTTHAIVDVNGYFK